MLSNDWQRKKSRKDEWFFASQSDSESEQSDDDFVDCVDSVGYVESDDKHPNYKEPQRDNGYSGDEQNFVSNFSAPNSHPSSAYNGKSLSMNDTSSSSSDSSSVPTTPESGISCCRRNSATSTSSPSFSSPFFANLPNIFSPCTSEELSQSIGPLDPFEFIDEHIPESSNLLVSSKQFDTLLSTEYSTEPLAQPKSAPKGISTLAQPSSPPFPKFFQTDRHKYPYCSRQYVSRTLQEFIHLLDSGGDRKRRNRSKPVVVPKGDKFRFPGRPNSKLARMRRLWDINQEGILEDHHNSVLKSLAQEIVKSSKDPLEHFTPAQSSPNLSAQEQFYQKVISSELPISEIIAQEISSLEHSSPNRSQHQEHSFPGLSPCEHVSPDLLSPALSFQEHSEPSTEHLSFEENALIDSFLQSGSSLELQVEENFEPKIFSDDLFLELVQLHRESTSFEHSLQDASMQEQQLPDEPHEFFHEENPFEETSRYALSPDFINHEFFLQEYFFPEPHPQEDVFHEELMSYSQLALELLSQESNPQEFIEREPSAKESTSQKSIPQEPRPQDLIPQEPIPQDPIPQGPILQKPIPRKSKTRNPIHRVSISRKLIARESIPRKPTNRGSIPKKPTPQKPLRKKPILQEPIPQKPIVQEPISQRPILQEPIPKKPILQKTITPEPKPLKRKTRRPIHRDSISRESIARESIPKKPIPKKPILQKTILQEPIPQKPILQEPIPQKPILQKQILRKPKPRKRKTRKPILRNSKSRESKARGSICRKPIHRESIPKKPTLQKPIPKKPILKEPIPQKSIPRKSKPPKLKPRKIHKNLLKLNPYKPTRRYSIAFGYIRKDLPQDSIPLELFSHKTRLTQTDSNLTSTHPYLDQFTLNYLLHPSNHKIKLPKPTQTFYDFVENPPTKRKRVCGCGIRMYCPVHQDENYFLPGIENI